YTCAPAGQCATNNGGCAQRCTADAVGAPVCSCLPGFTLAADGKACVSVGDVHLGNVELGLWLTMDTSFAAPHRLEFRTDAGKVRMEQVAGTTDTFTFTVQHTPGTCSDGELRETCVDQYRMCLLHESGFRLGRLWRGSAAGAPEDW